MSSDATTLPLGAVTTADRPTGLRGRLSGELADADTRVLGGTIALGTIVVLSLFVVLMAANRPSLLTPTTHIGYFPRWMAGPLGGLLPGFTNDGTTLKNLFTGAMVALYVSYVVALKYAPRLPARRVIATIVAANAIFL